MKCKIILGLLFIYVLSGNISATRSAEECVQYPFADLILQQCQRRWKDAGMSVLNDTSVESRNGPMHCFTSCLYDEMGIFYDHRFHDHMIAESIRKYVHHPSIEDLLFWSLQAAVAANEGGGHDCEIANNYWNYNNAGELKQWKHSIFCGRDPWLNPE